MNTAKKTISFLDVETTGMNPRTDRIIEIGIIQIRDNQIINEYNSLINPNTRVNHFIEKITGIRDEDLYDKPEFSSQINTISDIINNTIVVAHNASFDYNFLKYEYQRLDQKLSIPFSCSVRISRKLYPQYRRHNLDSLIERFNLNIENRHRALDDAKLIYDFFNIIQRDFSEVELHKVMEESIIRRR